MKRLLTCLAMMITPLSYSASNVEQPEEAGKVNWGRDLDAALVSSAKSGKPVFALFQ